MPVNVSLLRNLEADDIFISYSRADGSAYLTGLDAALSAREFSCFSDRKGTDADALPPETLFAKIRACKTFVLLATPGAILNPANIAPEVAAFAKANGTARIIPVTFDRSEPDDGPVVDLSRTPWHEHLKGKAREREDARAVVTGEPSRSIVDTIARASDYMKSKDRLRRYRNRAVGVLALLVVLIAVASAVAWWMTDLAMKASRRADDQTAIADSRSLVNAARLIREDPGSSVQGGIGKAIEAVAAVASRHLPSPESDAMLREMLALLPRVLRSQRIDTAIKAAALSPDAQHLAVLSDSGELKIFRAGETAPATRVSCGQGTAVAVNTGATVAAIGSGGTVRICDVMSGRTHTIDLQKDVAADPRVSLEIRSLALDPTGRYLALITLVRDPSRPPIRAHIEDDFTDAGVLEIATGREVVSLSAGEHNNSIAFGATGDLALASGVGSGGPTGTFKGAAFIWPLSRIHGLEPEPVLAPGDFARVETYRQDAEVRVIAVGPRAAAFALETGIWTRNDVGTFVETGRFPYADKTADLSRMAFSDTGRELTALRPAQDGANPKAVPVIETWDTAVQPDRSRVQLSNITAVGWLPGGQSVLAAFVSDTVGNPRVFDAGTGRDVHPESQLPCTSLGRPDFCEVKFVSENARFAIEGNADHAYIRDAWQWEDITLDFGREIRGFRDWSVAMTRDGTFLALAGPTPDGLETAAVIYRRQGNAFVRYRRVLLKGLNGGFGNSYPGDSGRLAITPDAEYLLTLTDRGVRVWATGTASDVTTGWLRASVEGKSVSLAKKLTMSSTGAYAAVVYTNGCREGAEAEACAGSDPTSADGVDREYVAIVRVRDGSLVANLPHGAQVNTVVFSPNDVYALTAGGDASTWLVALRTQETRRLAVSVSINVATFSADESLLALGTAQRTVLVMPKSPDAPLLTLPDGEVGVLAFRDDNREIATVTARENSPYVGGSRGGILEVWRLRPEDVISAARDRLTALPPYLRDDRVIDEATKALARIVGPPVVNSPGR